MDVEDNHLIPLQSEEKFLWVSEKSGYRHIYLYDYSGKLINPVLHYGSATGVWASFLAPATSSSNYFHFPAGTTIQPCQYILVGNVNPGPTILGAPLPVPVDFSFTLNMSASLTGGGKALLASANNSNVACNSEVGLIDKLAWGTANCPEVTATAAIGNTQGAVRNAAGATDSDNNVNDFAVVTNPVPRNSTSFNPACLVTPTKSSTWGQVKSIYR